MKWNCREVAVAVEVNSREVEVEVAVEVEVEVAGGSGSGEAVSAGRKLDLLIRVDRKIRQRQGNNFSEVKNL